MTRHQQLTPVSISVPPHAAYDDLRLDIDVRLRVVGTDEEDLRKPESQGPPSASELYRLASGIYQARRKRDKLLNDELFGEPAWDMLLALYCFPPRGERLGVTGLSYAANVPQTTGYRVQLALAERGLIEKQKEESDARRQLVTLTEKGRAMLESYLMLLLSGNSAAQSCLRLARF